MQKTMCRHLKDKGVCDLYNDRCVGDGCVDRKPVVFSRPIKCKNCKYSRKPTKSEKMVLFNSKDRLICLHPNNKFAEVDYEYSCFNSAEA